ncbi:amino acid ABC transporter membrane protein 1 (PAAT family) [Marinomonas balearica]|uniref:Amino acid ABC transporter membrane protein 1 (PAAT family) n=2 Tax=Marinomonas balearica TaxID=491947 RepID=A0A4R6M9C4_9GAMM|nr:amino acid ABC transporter membrane protein 1 (PAAT family) [Marinomonas balearica]
MMNSLFHLEGYGGLLLSGAWMTIKLSLLSFLCAMLLGVVTALAKRAKSTTLYLIASAYTVLIRGVPDLVLMLLLFYGIQSWVGDVCLYFGWDYIVIDPFHAGVITLAFIYGAYFSETFRGALQSIPKGQIEAALAYGLSNMQSFRFVIFPQMMRLSIPGISNIWQVMIKATALVSIIGLNDLINAAVEAGKSTNNVFSFLLLAGAMYLAYTMVSNAVFSQLNRYFHVGIKESKS